MLDILKINCRDYYLRNKVDYLKIESFMNNHIEYLRNKKLLKLFFQNKYAYYRKLKTMRGRIMDLVYCLK